MIIKYRTQFDKIEAVEILREAGLGDADCSMLDGTEKENLRLLVGERGINFTGL